MKISTKGRYALRLMLDLAVNYTGEYITIKNIAKRPAYLWFWRDFKTWSDQKPRLFSVDE